MNKKQKEPQKTRLAKDYRISRGLTQQEVVNKADRVGVSLTLEELQAFEEGGKITERQLLLLTALYKSNEYNLLRRQPKLEEKCNVSAPAWQKSEWIREKNWIANLPLQFEVCYDYETYVNFLERSQGQITEKNIKTWKRKHKHHSFLYVAYERWDEYRWIDQNNLFDCAIQFMKTLYFARRGVMISRRGFSRKECRENIIKQYQQLIKYDNLNEYEKWMLQDMLNRLEEMEKHAGKMSCEDDLKYGWEL